MGKKALAALGAGLGSIGQSIMQNEQTKRDIEAKKTEQANRDREFELRKGSYDLAVETQRQKLMQNEILNRMRQMGQVITMANFEPKATVQAINDFGNLPYKMQIDPSQTNANQVAFRQGQYEKDAEGNIVSGPDGRPVFIDHPKYSKTENDGLTVLTLPEFANISQKIMKPGSQVALWLTEEQEKIKTAGATAREEAKGEVSKGVQKETLQTDLRRARAEKLRKEAEVIGTEKGKDIDKGMRVEGAWGPVKLGDREAQGLDRFVQGIQKAGEHEDVDPGMAHRFSQLMGKSEDAARERKQFNEWAKLGHTREDLISTAMQQFSLTETMAERYIDNLNMAIEEKSKWETFKSLF